MSKQISNVALISAAVGVLGVLMALAGYAFGAGEAMAGLVTRVDEHDRQIQMLLKDRDTLIEVATTVKAIDKRLQNWDSGRKP